MGESDHGPVGFDAGDVSSAVALLRAHATTSDDITAWIDIRPLDVPSVGGWQGGFEATGVDIADYGRRIYGQ